MAKIADWRKQENQKLKKLLERQNIAQGGEGQVSDRQVESWLNNQFVNSALEKAKAGKPLTAAEQAELAKQRIEIPTANAPATPSTGAPTAPNGVMPPPTLSTEDRGLKAISQLPGQSAYYDPSGHAPTQEFWRTTEFHDLIKEQLVQKQGGAVNTITAQGNVVKKGILPSTSAPTPPEMRDLMRNRGYTGQPQSFVLKGIMEKFGPPAETPAFEAPKQEFVYQDGKPVPFYPENKLQQQLADVAQSVENDPNASWLKKAFTWTIVGAAIPFNHWRTQQFITLGGEMEEELIYQDAGAGNITPENVYGPLFSAVFNTGMFGVEFVTAGIRGLSQEIYKQTHSGYTQEKVDQFTQAARDAEKAGNFKDRDMYLKIAADQQKVIDKMNVESPLERMNRALDITKQEWNRLYQSSADYRQAWSSTFNLISKYLTPSSDDAARKEAMDTFDKEWADFKLTVPPPPYVNTPEAVAWRERKAQLEELARNDEFRNSERAKENYLKTQDPNVSESDKQLYASQAISSQIQAINARIKLDPYDSFGSATWVREPERYQQFMEAVALHELQAGRPSTTYEVRQLKEMYQNGWTEMGFQFVFDLTNFIPLVGEVLGNIPVIEKVMSRVAKASGVVKEAAQAGKLGSIVKWATTRGVISTAKNMEHTIADVMVRMSGGYGNDVAKFMEDIETYEQLAKYMQANPAKAEEAFMDAQATTKGLGQITFQDFKKLSDASSGVSISQWSDLMQMAKTATEDALAKDMIHNALVAGEVVDEGAMLEVAAREAQKPKYMGMTSGIFAENFSKAFKKSHLIKIGSHLTDDTVLGAALLRLRALGSSAKIAGPGLINEAIIEDSKVLKNLALKGATLSDGVKSFLLKTSSVVEGISSYANFAKGLWTTAVLMTPRWVITNMIDSFGRDVVYGGNMWDDIITLMTSTQAHFAEEVGFNPMVLGMSLADDSLSLAESVPFQLMYRGYKPEFGVFSYMARRYDMLKQAEKEVPVFDSLGRKVAEELANSLPAEQAGIFRQVYNGFKNTGGAVAGGLTDFNTAIEFTVRTRMFHREYFGLLKKLEGQFINRGMEGMNDAAKALATQIWKEAGGNPARIPALVKSLTTGGGEKGFLSTFMMPAEFEEALKMVPPEQAAALTYTIQRQTAQFLTSTVAATGKGPTPEMIKGFISDMRDGLTDAIQHTMSQQQNMRNIRNTIDVTQVADMPDASDLNGSLPVFGSEEFVTSGINKLNRTKPFQKAEDVVLNYKKAMSSYAEIEAVEGNSIHLVPLPGGRVKLQVGNALYEQKSTKVYEIIHETTIKTMSMSNPAMLGKLDIVGTNQAMKIKRLEAHIKDFLIDPTKVLGENEKAFLYIVDMFDENPQMYNLLRKTGQVQDYTSAYDLYRAAPAMPYQYDMIQDPQALKTKIMEDNDLIMAPSADHRAASLEYRIAWKDANQTITEIPELFEPMRDINNLTSVHHREYMVFSREVFPGPRRFGSADGRGGLWDEYEAVMANAYRAEAKIANELKEATLKNPAEAAKLMQEWRDNFPIRFLNELGVDVTMDDNGIKVLMAKVRRSDGKTITFHPGSSTLNYIQSVFFSPKGNDVLAYATSLRGIEGLKFRTTASTLMQQTFKIPAEHAKDWVRLMEVQAENMAKITGGVKEEFLGRFGFEVVDGQWQLAPDGIERLTTGMVRRTEDGGYNLIGIGESSPESLITAMSIPFYDDMVTAADYNMDVANALSDIQDYLSLKSRKVVGKVPNNVQREEFARLFASYLSKGVAPDPKLQKIFGRFETYLGSYFKVIKDSNIAQEIPDEVYRSLNRIFVLQEMKPPKANVNTAQAIMEEAGVKIDPEELLKRANWVEPMSDVRYVANGMVGSPEDIAQLEDLVNKIEANPNDFISMEKFNKLTDKLKGKIDRVGPPFANTLQVQREAEEALRVSKGVLEKEGIDTSNMTEVQIIQKATDLVTEKGAQNPALFLFNELKDALTKAKRYKRYEDVGDIPMGKMEVFMSVKTHVVQEVDEAFKAFKMNRFEGFPKYATQSVDDLKDYLRRNIKGADALSMKYETMLWDVENFQDKVLAAIRTKTADQPIDWEKALFTQVHKFQMSDGMLSYVRSSTGMVNNYEAALQAIDRLEEYLLKGGWQTPTLSSETAGQLTKWAEVGVKAKADLVSTLLSGGEVNGTRITGAIQKVNDVMLDYSDSSNFDGLMKNIFPFWMFPSRSMPFWMKTLATHPNIVSAYLKLKRLSRTSRYQAGAITSQGQPLPSLDGYIPIPGTDIWVNPMAPFSSKYVLNMLDVGDNAMYAVTEGDTEESPLGFIAQQMIESGPIFGFTPAPWITGLITNMVGESNRGAPAFAAFPEIPLIPRWMVAEALDKANKINFFGQGLGDALYPEASWHDYLVERKILTDALQQMSSTTDKEAILERTRLAIAEKGDNEVWQQAYKDLTNQEAGQAWSSFFTGIYPKEFTDAQADLYALRNDINLMKSTLNNEFQAAVFQMPDDAETGWQQYLDKQSTPEGWMYRLYTDIGYVKNDAGEAIRNKEERAKYVALAIESEINQQEYYNVRNRRQAEFERRLKAVPVGAPYEVVANLYDQYYKDLAADQKTYPFSYNSSFYTNKPAELIEKELINDYFKLLNSTRPRYDAKEDYAVYEQRVAEWETRLPSIAPLALQALQSRPEVIGLLSGLRPDQQLNENLFPWMLEMGNTVGVQAWKLSNDDVFDALNNAWKTTYWDEYWNTVGDLKGAERNLAEKDFNDQHPAPNEAQMYAWIVMTYGDRFTYEDVIKWMNYGQREVYDIRERVLAEKGKEYTLKQDIYDYFSWIGPAQKSQLVAKIDAELYNITKDDRFSMENWKKNEGALFSGDQQNLQKFLSAIQQAYARLGIQQPNRDYMVEYVQAEDANNQFKKIVNDAGLGADYDHLIEIQAAYYNAADINRREKAKWITTYQDEYRMLQQYWRMRDSFAKTSPIWNEYYMWKPKIPEQLQSAMNADYDPTALQSTSTAPSTTTPVTSPTSTPTYSGGGSVKPPSGGTGTPPPSSGTNTKFSGKVYWPTKMQSTIGTTLTREIEALYSGQPLSQSAITFLQGLKIRHPEWRGFINKALEKAALISG